MKKLNKFFAVLVALAMVLSLGVVSAFAADPNAQTGGIPGAGKNATLTKTLSMPEGVTQNTAREFTFDFAADTNNPSAAAIEDKSFTPAVDTTATDDEGTLFGKAADVLSGVNWTAPGVYTYVVTEEKPTAATYDADTRTDTIVTNPESAEVKKTVTETYVYSGAEYKMLVGVASYDDNGTTKYYVESVSVIQTKKQDGTAIPEAEQKKVPITNPTDNTANGFVFENKYNKTVETTPTGKPDDPTPGPNTDGSSLYIGKQILNKQADNSYAETGITDEQANKDFRMNITVTFPANGSMTEYVAKVVNAQGVTQATEYKFTKPAEGNSASKVISIKTGERIVFTKIEYGAKYTVDEDDYPAYSAENEVATATLIKDDVANGTTVNNKYDPSKDPATGLSIANLPFIVLALVAVGGLVAYIVVRRKSEDNA